MTELEKVSYALGLSMGNNFKSSGVEELNIKEFGEGGAAVFEGAKPKMSYDEAKNVIRDFFMALEQKQNEAAAKMGEVNKAAGEAFLAENAKRAEVKTTESGLQYEVIAEGNGDKPAASDTVVVHYTGTLIDGTVFDSSVERGEPTSFGLNQVIAGWTEGLQLMPVGSKFRFYIPQELGYGSRNAGSIPPYSTLIFEVDLLGIEK